MLGERLNKWFKKYKSVLEMIAFINAFYNKNNHSIVIDFKIENIKTNIEYLVPSIVIFGKEETYYRKISTRRTGILKYLPCRILYYLPRAVRPPESFTLKLYPSPEEVKYLKEWSPLVIPLKLPTESLKVTVKDHRVIEMVFVKPKPVVEIEEAEEELEEEYLEEKKEELIEILPEPECEHEFVRMCELRNFRGDIRAVLKCCKKCGKVIREDVP